MIKCRVKQKGLEFYPQYRKFIFWKPCPKFVWKIYNHKDNLSENNKVIYVSKTQYLCYDTLKDAELCLSKFIKEFYAVDKYKKHIIKIASDTSHEYSNNLCTYYYSESYKIYVNEGYAYPICGETIKEVMNKIDIFESKMALIKVRKIYTYDE